MTLQIISFQCICQAHFLCCCFHYAAGGFVGIFSKCGAYQRWCCTTSTQAQYFDKMLEMCCLIDDPDCPKAGKHHELERAEIKMSQLTFMNWWGFHSPLYLLVLVQLMVPSIRIIKLHFYISSQMTIRRIFLIQNVPYKSKMAMHLTDSYHADSIKAQEQLRWGSSQSYLIQEPATRKPSNFKLFLENEQNKTQLWELLLKVWSSNAAASCMEQCRTALVIVDGKAYQLQSSDGEVSNWIAYVNLL